MPSNSVSVSLLDITLLILDLSEAFTTEQLNLYNSTMLRQTTLFGN